MQIAERAAMLAEATKLLTELTANQSIQETLAVNGKTADGGYLCVTNAMGVPYCIEHIGQFDREKADDRLVFSQEKALRLSQHPDHVLSRQSENREENKFPGAIRTATDLFSFSGLPGHLDELYMLILAVRTGKMLADTARSILAAYPNEYATREVIDAFLPV